jgi:hypothetical protein
MNKEKLSPERAHDYINGLKGSDAIEDATKVVYGYDGDLAVVCVRTPSSWVKLTVGSQGLKAAESAGSN